MQIHSHAVRAVCRLHDVVYENTCVHLVLEHLDRNLKDHMDSSPNDFKNRDIVKVRSLVNYYI